MKRRNFIFDIFSVGLISSITPRVKAKNFKINNMVRSISTWKTTEANLKAGLMLDKGIDGLSAAIAGVAIEEENPKNTTVGFGGAPDRSGRVTLDACVMNHLGDYKPIINIENHDTIGMLCLDKNNNISGACTTSGLAYKMKGRVGDSPIIGSGLFIDNDIGGAVATGLGEEVLKTVGSFLVVELMRQGKSPQEACESAVKRIVSSNSQKNKFQVAYIAMNKEGDVGSYSVEPGFTYMDYFNGENKEKITESAF